MDRESAINRIQKLISLSEGTSSEAEANLAMKLARRLMIEHAVSEAEARDGKPKEQVVEHIIKLRARWRWHVDLLSLCAEQCGCRSLYWRRSKATSSTFNQAAIIGYKSDTEIAEYLYHAIAVQLDAKADEYASRLRDGGAEFGQWYSARVAFVDSAMYSVGERMRSMRRQATQEAQAQGGSSTALVLASRKRQVDIFYRERTKGSRSMATRERQWNSAGYEAGKTINIADAISGPATKGELQ